MKFKEMKIRKRLTTAFAVIIAIFGTAENWECISVLRYIYFVQVNFSEKLWFISHLGLSWSSEVLDSYFSCQSNDFLSIMYEKFISKYNRKHLQPSPGNQLSNEHIWQVAMNTIEERAERVKQASSKRCQLIIVSPHNRKKNSIKNWDANDFTISELKN